MAFTAGTLKKVFTWGVVGVAFTAGGMLFGPFMAKAAGGAALAQGATAGSVAFSFHAPLVTSAATGEVGALAAAPDIINGIPALAKSVWHIAQAVVNPNMTVAEAIATPFAALG